jgi:hypothetical protein
MKLPEFRTRTDIPTMHYGLATSTKNVATNRKFDTSSVHSSPSNARDHLSPQSLSTRPTKKQFQVLYYLEILVAEISEALCDDATPSRYLRSLLFRLQCGMRKAIVVNLDNHILIMMNQMCQYILELLEKCINETYIVA